jgi:hypothetical protein
MNNLFISMLCALVLLTSSFGADVTSTVDLGEADGYAILAKTGISTVPSSAITGLVAVSPAAGAAMTGFSLTMDATGAFATCTQVTGQMFAANYKGAVPQALTNAVLDMQAAYDDAANRTTNDTGRINYGGGNLGAGGEVGGPDEPLTTGVHTFGTNVNIVESIHFHGSSTDVFIMQTTGNLIMAANKKVILSGGALAKNIFWQVAGEVTVGAGSHMEGILLVKTKVTLITGSTLNGRILAQTSVALQMATVDASMV